MEGEVRYGGSGFEVGCPQARSHPSLATHRVYPRPLASRAGHGRYALMGHQPKPGRAPMPPAMRPSTHLKGRGEGG